jgi:hypothetical protein
VAVVVGLFGGGGGGGGGIATVVHVCQCLKQAALLKLAHQI